ncbi:MAG: hypothetical protein ACR2ND_11705 [Solirubrobacteraceae bacterium]
MMRRAALIAAAATGSGLIAAGVPGGAGAQAPASPIQRVVSVQGVGSAPVDSAATGEAATAAYRQALGSAVADGQNKASFLAGRAGGTLGPVQSIGEGGGYIDCGQGEYAGVQPDFGTGAQFVAAASAPAGAPAVTGAPVARRKQTPRKKKKSVRRRHPRRRAKARAASTCTLNAQVSLSYTLS